MIETVTYSGVDGATVTSANTTYDSVLATGGSLVFDTDEAYRGASGSIVATGTTTSGVVYGSKDITATDALAFDIPVKPVALPSGELYFLQLGVGATRNIALATTSTGLLRVRDAANANAWSSAAGVLIPDSPCIISVYVTRHASAGTFRIVVYEIDGVTVRADSGAQTAKNTGASAFTNIRASGAKSATGALASQWVYGEPRWDVAATDLLPAWAATSHRAAKRWDGTKYVDLDCYRWNGTAYVPVDRADL